MLEEHPGAALTGVPSGFIDYDRMTHGLGKGTLIIIGGRPGMGKTSFALEHRFARRDPREEDGRDLLARDGPAGAGAAHPVRRSRRFLLAHPLGTPVAAAVGKVVQKMGEIGKAPMFIDDSASPTLLEVASKARRLKAEKGLEVLFIDYLQLMQAGGRFENRNLEISAITRSFKQLAKELDIPIILLSQLSRASEKRGGDHRPVLSDLRESGSIEQDADLVAFIYRDEVYNKERPFRAGTRRVDHLQAPQRRDRHHQPRLQGRDDALPQLRSRARRERRWLKGMAVRRHCAEPGSRSISRLCAATAGGSPSA